MADADGQVWRRETARPFEDSDVVRILASPLAEAA